MKQLNQLSVFFSEIFSTRRLLWKLSKNDFKARHASSFFGIFWAYIQPLMMLVTMWFVFEIALGNGAQDGVPFIVWFAPAMLVWNFFSEALTSMTSGVKDYAYLVRKVNFRVGILPLVKLLSASFIHFSMLLVVAILLILYRVGFSLYNLQLLYYLPALFLLLMGLGWLLSAASLFAPDVRSLVSIAMTVGFWASPVSWNPTMLSAYPLILNVLKFINPMYYIIEGYRDTFLGRMWFWEKPPLDNLVFWLTSLVLFFFGALIFNKLRPQFADVL